MIHAAALFSSLASLGLICLIYACNVLAPRDSWLRAEWLASILLSLLTGLFPLALAASLTGLWGAISEGITLGAILSASADLTSLAATIATVVVFRAILKANAASRANPDNITPRPTKPHVASRVMKKAA
ncbi:hypothetical protein P1J78_22080 [Psychromarinibacter sp. C21-152]|uniref:Uncharacterized protein n=1 Tax=Psychromarinibacter sediminicola TaxID=3033385 RepID=A0AAE3NWB3_9RHOB|nr:hypothetical protein [Psychromarinibacter sediminicola]MDF0603424.1 hypothetical protein [Psychromarinibacter sediminicola]